MREKRREIVNLLHVLGITPACAGKTSFILAACLVFWDHPRVCGKNPPLPYTLYDVGGSPPRVREKLIGGVVVIVALRITPACAGKTIKTSTRRYTIRDHPRVCGKNLQTYEPTFTWEGSPPRVREKRDKIRLEDYVYGITPACAGKTLPFEKR